MQIEALKKYKALVNEIKAIEEEIEDLYMTCKATTFDKQPMQHSSSSPVEIAVRKIIPLSEKLEQLKLEMVKQREEINEYINTIDDYEIRTICRYKYILGLSWNEIGKRLNTHYTNPRKKLMKYLERETDER